MNHARRNLPFVGEFAGAELEALDGERIAVMLVHEVPDRIIEFHTSGYVFIFQVGLVRTIDQWPGQLPGLFRLVGAAHHAVHLGGKLAVRNSNDFYTKPFSELVRLVDTGQGSHRRQAAVRREQDSRLSEDLPGPKQAGQRAKLIIRIRDKETQAVAS